MDKRKVEDLNKEYKEIAYKKTQAEGAIAELEERATKIIAEGKLKADGLLETANANVQALQSELGQKQARLNMQLESLNGRELAVSKLEDEREEIRLKTLHLQAKEKGLENETAKAVGQQETLSRSQAYIETKVVGIAKMEKELDARASTLSVQESSLKAVQGDIESNKSKAALALSEAESKLAQVGQKTKELDQRASTLSDKESVLALKDEELTHKEAKLTEVIGNVEADKKLIQQEFNRINHEKSMLSQQRLGLLRGDANAPSERK